MRIVSRKELMSLPAGTVYSSYQPHVFNGLYAKEGTIKGFDGDRDIDWYMTSLLDELQSNEDEVSAIHCDVMARFERGEDVPLEFGECYGRDGAFNEADRFAVWSKADLLGLAAFLTKAAEVAK